MRDVSRRVCGAFLARQRASIKNTRSDGERLTLHGNTIAWWQGRTLCLTMAGWGSTTTRERLNALCELYVGRRPFSQQAGEQWYAMGARAKRCISTRDVIRIESIAYLDE